MKDDRLKVQRHGAFNRAMLASVALVFAAGQVEAQGPPSQPTYDNCRTTYLSRLNSCCGIQDQGVRATCFQGANLLLQHCLNSLPPGEHPVDCWDSFGLFLTDCVANGGPCGTSESQNACADGAFTMLEWCAASTSTSLGISDEDGNLDWKHDKPILLGKTYELKVQVKSDIINGVTFWAIDSSKKGKDMVYQIGDAALTYRSKEWFGIPVPMSFWATNIDTRMFEGVTGQVQILARAEFDGVPVRVAMARLEVRYMENDLNRDMMVTELDAQVAVQRGLGPERVKQIIEEATGNMK